MNERLALHAKRIGIQDGSSRTALRDWLEEITSAKEWTRATEVQTINMIGYLLKGDIAEPLTGLTRKKDKFLWEEEQESAFQNLKTALTSHNVMAHPNTGVTRAVPRKSGKALPPRSRSPKCRENAATSTRALHMAWAKVDSEVYLSPLSYLPIEQ